MSSKAWGRETQIMSLPAFVVDVVVVRDMMFIPHNRHVSVLLFSVQKFGKMNLDDLKN